MITQLSQPFVKKILILGAECTGKSTLSRDLAQHFNTVYVPEFMRTYLDKKPAGYICQYDDLIPIAKGQIDSENQLVTQANRFLFCDTSLILLQVYSEFYFDKCPDFIRETIPKLQYDKIFVTDNVGVTWVADGQRDLPNGHDEIFARIEKVLQNNGLNYHHISGNRQQRLNSVINLLKNR